MTTALDVTPLPLVHRPVATLCPVSKDFADPNPPGAAGMPWRRATTFTDLVGLLAIIWTLPVVLLLVAAPIGIPIWLARLAFHAQ